MLTHPKFALDAYWCLSVVFQQWSGNEVDTVRSHFSLDNNFLWFCILSSIAVYPVYPKDPIQKIVCLDKQANQISKSVAEWRSKNASIQKFSEWPRQEVSPNTNISACNSTVLFSSMTCFWCDQCFFLLMYCLHRHNILQDSDFWWYYLLLTRRRLLGVRWTDAVGMTDQSLGSSDKYHQ